MHSSISGYSNCKVIKQGGHLMDDTHAFVEKVHENQKKAEKNKEHHGKSTPSQKLPNKQHGKN